MIDAQNIINRLLMENEQVLWIGNPNSGKLLTKHDAFLIPFSLIWCSFIAFWSFNAIPIALKQNFAFLVVIIGIFFSAIGIYILFGRFIYKQFDKKHICYVITNKRIFVIKKYRTPQISYLLLNDSKIAVTVIKHNSKEDILFSDYRFIEYFLIKTGLDFLFFTRSCIVFLDIDECEKIDVILSNLLK